MSSRSEQMVNEVALAMLVAIISGLVCKTSAPLECLMMVLRPVLQWTVGDDARDDIRDESESEASATAAYAGVRARAKAAGASKSGRAKTPSGPPRKDAKKSSPAQAKDAQAKTVPETEPERKKAMSGDLLLRSQSDRDAVLAKPRSVEAVADGKAILDGPSRQDSVPVLDEVDIGLTVAETEHIEKQQSHPSTCEAASEAEAVDETLNGRAERRFGAAWGDDEANTEFEAHVGAEDGDAATSAEDEDDAVLSGPGIIYQPVPLDGAIQTQHTESPHNPVLMFHQPPGLEVESETLIQRLMRRNIELEEMLARAEVPPVAR